MAEQTPGYFDDDGIIDLGGVLWKRVGRWVGDDGHERYVVRPLSAWACRSVPDRLPGSMTLRAREPVDAPLSEGVDVEFGAELPF